MLSVGRADRLVSVSNENTCDATGLCLDPYGLCAAKLMANRSKDRAFVMALVGAKLVYAPLMADRLGQVELDSFEGAERERYVHNLDSALDWLRSLIA